MIVLKNRHKNKVTLFFKYMKTTKKYKAFL